MSVALVPPQKRSKPKYHSYPIWCPRFWHGMVFGDWIRLLADNRFRVQLTRIPTALSITFFSVTNSGLRWLQELCYRRRIANTEIEQAPLFILGHWRSGTTYLHELLVLDDRFSYPTTYQCFAPHHFLLTEWWMVTFGGFLIPKQRPMDNMQSGWNLIAAWRFPTSRLWIWSPWTCRVWTSRTFSAEKGSGLNGT